MHVTPASPLHLRLEASCDHAAVASSDAVAVWLHARLTAPALPAQSDTSRAPIDVALVLDRSGSMGGAKIALLRRTCRALIASLSEADRLAIVAYDNEVSTLLPLTYQTTAARVDSTRITEALVERGATNLCDALLAGLDLLEASPRRTAAGAPVVASVMLLTDGEANDSFKQAHEIIHLMRVGASARSAQYEQMRADDAYLQRHAGEVERLCRPVPATVHTFGFGTDANVTLLKSIADAGAGSYFFIEQERSIFDSFADCIGGLLSTYAKDIELTFALGDSDYVSCPTAFRVTHSAATNTVSVVIPDLQAEEARDVLVSFRTRALAARAGSELSLRVGASYTSVIGAAGLVTLEPRFAAVARGDETRPLRGNKEIELQKNRILVAQALEQAGACGDNVKAKAIVDAATAAVEASGVTAESAPLLRDLEGAAARMTSQAVYAQQGQAYAYANAASHSKQRSVNTSSASPSAYSTSERANQKMKFAMF